MKPALFEYLRPGTVDEAAELLERHNADARILAGGQSLVPMLNFRLAQAKYLIDTNAVTDLSYIRDDGDCLAIGAMVRQSAIEDSPLIAAKCPLLTEATRLIGHRTIRNRGTIGGSVAHADPNAEYPTVLAVLDAEMVARGVGGERRIPARDFFITYCTTSLAPNELLTEVRVPVLPEGSGWAFEELSTRHGDYAIVGVAAVVTLDAAGRCDSLRIALAGVGGTPIRCADAEVLATGGSLDDERIDTVAMACTDVADPQNDMHATAEYKRAMVGVLVRRALKAAVGRSGS